MMQVIEQTHEEKLKMYMKFSKKQLAEMLINCNVIISAMPVRVEFKTETPTEYPFWATGPITEER